MSRRALAWMMILPFLAPPALAQDAPAGPAELLGAAPRGFNAAVEGERRLGLYFSDRYIGHTAMRVERAPEGSGATYRVTLTMEMALGDMRQKGTNVALLDERFAIVERSEDEAGSQRTRKRRWFREGGAWVREVTEGDRTTRTTFASDQPDHGEEVLVQLMLVAAGGPRPGTYRLPTVVWPEGEGEARHGHIELTIEPAAQHEHRGQSVPASRMRLIEADGETNACVVDAAGWLLSMRPEGEGAPPIRMTAGTAEQLDADARPPAAPEAGSPVAAVQVFFEVLSKQRQPEALDEVIDWTAVRDEMATKNPDIAAMTPDQIATIFKQRFAEQAGPSPEQVAMLVQLLKVEVEGDDARVKMPGREHDPVLLRRREGRWWIVHMPGT